jgi:1-deoxy-D-xylulose-5-phosphate synthase
MARARTLSDKDHSVIAFIGDGALMGGLAFEGLSDAGASGEPIVIILNDNGMSITRNVGGVARYLSRQRLKPSYAAFKKRYRRIMDILPGGRAIYRFTHSVKTTIKEALLHCSMFEEMGLQYSGAIDGHNIKRVVTALEWAKKQTVPTVVQKKKKKGKGYLYSEQSPEDYHGVNPFDYKTGVVNNTSESFSTVFGDELTKLAQTDDRICAITASMAPGTGLNEFAERYPKRFFDIGIAEGHAAVMAAAMASGGFVPVFAVYSSFLQRSYDMLLHDVAIGGHHIVLAVDRAGLVPGDGETHQGVYDVSFLTSIPNMTILCPASFAELRDMLGYAINNVDGPVAIRYPRGGEGLYKDGGTDGIKLICKGTDYTLVTYGETINIAIEAADILKKDGISVEIIKLGLINPLDMEPIIQSINKTSRLLILEECSARGSIGEYISARLAQARIVQSGIVLKCLTLLNTGDKFIPSGDIDELRAYCGVDVGSVCNVIKEGMNMVMSNNP